MDVRVRLVFADDVGRHVQRHRGFSACWYLVPKEAKLVGDLAHALLREFGLRKRCPRGLELRLDELPLLATQSARIVRDDDTIVVQCRSLEEEDACDGSSASENKVVAPKQRKRKDRGKTQTVKQPEKKTKRNEDALKQVAVGVYSKEKKKAVNEKDEGKKSVRVETSSSDSNSDSESSSNGSSSGSSSSSDSESSSSESSSDSSSSSDVETDLQQKPKRLPQAAPAKQREKAKEATAAKSPNGDASKTNEKEPRRRRRRLRQRNGRRQRNGSQANSTDNSAGSAMSPSNKGTALQSTRPEEPKLASSARHDNTSVAGLGCYPRAKGHVLFDQETGDRLADKHAETDTGENGWATQDPELAKYGPSYSGNQRSRAPRDNRDEASAPFHDESNHEADDKNKYVDAPKRKGKGEYEERWKRPYEIVATVLDKNAEDSSKTNPSTPDLTKLLASYPKAVASSCRFEQKDVIAFKTLTLCLETWQPLLSDWQCGQVQTADASGNSIELSDWTLAAKGETVDFRSAPNSKPRSVPTGEINELRFLSGPTYSSLRQSS